MGLKGRTQRMELWWEHFQGLGPKCPGLGRGAVGAPEPFFHKLTADSRSTEVKPEAKQASLGQHVLRDWKEDSRDFQSIAIGKLPSKTWGLEKSSCAFLKKSLKAHRPKIDVCVCECE